MSKGGPQSPAALLAAVLRVVAPETEHEKWFATTPPVGDFGDVYRDDTRKVFHHAWTTLDSLNVDSKDDLVRVVGMLDGAQEDMFNQTLAEDEPSVVTPGDAYKATPAQILAALVAAVGVNIQNEQPQ